MPRQTNQQKQIDTAVKQFAQGLSGLLQLFVPVTSSTPPNSLQLHATAPEPKPGRGGRGRKVKTVTAPRTKRRISAKTRLLFKQQGAYMGLVRRLSAAKKAELKKLRMAKGYEAAIALARKMVATT